jgi:large subunit ribosomal protein L21
MYAVLKTGGKQYRVKEGDILKIEKVEGEVGQTLELEEVLLIGNSQEPKVGQPLVPNAKIVVDIVDQGKAKKIVVFKSKRRKGYRKKQGHRQMFTSVKINKIIG